MLRILPGEYAAGDVVLVTGAVPDRDLWRFCRGLKGAVLDSGGTASVLTPGPEKSMPSADQYGPPESWDLSYDLCIVNIGPRSIASSGKYGRLPNGIEFSRTLFMTPAAELSAGYSLMLPDEERNQRLLVEHLSGHFPSPINLVRPSMVALTLSEEALRETNEQILGALEAGRHLPESLIQRRELWRTREAKEADAPHWSPKAW